MSLRAKLAYAIYKRKERARYRDLHLVTDLPGGDPHTMTRNATVKLMLGIGPDEQVTDSEDIEYRRLIAQETLKELRQCEKAKVK